MSSYMVPQSGAERVPDEEKMKITTTVTTLEGAPEELASFYKASDITAPLANLASSAPTMPEATTEQLEAISGERRYIDSDTARRVLTRLPLSAEMKIVLKRCYQARPGKASAAELQQATGYNPRQLAGLMGAFGRRCVNTAGYPKNFHFFDWERDDHGWTYGFPQSVCDALETLKLV